MSYLNVEQIRHAIRRGSALLAAVFAWIITASPAAAQNFTVLTNFDGEANFTGMSPSSALIQGPDGSLYGTANYGGAFDSGVVFKTQPDGSDFSLIWSFSGGDGGSDPGAGVLLVGNTLYGTTYEGGSNNVGIIFSVETNGANFTVLHTFAGGTHDGANSTAALVISSNTLYGTAYSGGSDDLGILFSIETNGTNFKDIYDFKGGLDCGNPYAGLTLTNNVLYGTTTGSSSLITYYGSVFKINANGSGFTVLKTFLGPAGGGGGDGANPYGGVIELAGSLYGTTDSGTPGYGTVFRLNTNGGSFSTLYTFSGGSDGNAPYSTLALLGATLYGTTFSGGADGVGAIFRVSINGGGFANIYSFTNGNDGSTPYGGVILVDGSLYGAAFSGGTNGYGTIFKKTAGGTLFSTEITFQGAAGTANPTGPLALLNDTLYGMTQNGGTSLKGTIFTLNTNGSGLTTLRDFSGPDGAYPIGPILQTNGFLYGATSQGGSNNGGVIFTIATNGASFTNLHEFSGPDGASPVTSLTLSDGILYGATPSGGSNNDGVLFRLGTDGSGFQILRSFSGADGNYPLGQLIITNGVIYGVTMRGGASGSGVIYQVNIGGGQFNLLHNFSAPEPSGNTNEDGADPTGQLIQQGNYLYGITSFGGLSDLGSIFRISLSGDFTTVAYPPIQVDYAAGSLVLGQDNNFFGAASQGGTNGAGTLFQLTPSGAYTPLVSLSSFNGFSVSALTLAPDGTFFGAAAGGGIGGSGTIFHLNPNYPEVSLAISYDTILAGSNVVLIATGAGEPPLFFQWELNGAPISGATNSALTLANISPSQSGSYAITLSNSFGSVEAGAVRLGVLASIVGTYSAGGIGQSNAILNGSISYGASGTAAWFDWGTDTNYGSIAGFETLPGSFGTTVAITNLLTGLVNGSTYHYRTVASNSFGVTYGNDISFQVGFAPTVLTLGILDPTANSATLTASVNSHGLETLAYFQWGYETYDLVNQTPAVDVGSDSIPFNFQSLLSGLTTNVTYYYRVVASNQLGTVYGAAQPFSLGAVLATSAPIHNWDSLAASADGSILLAAGYDTGTGGPIYTSTDYGYDWTPNNVPLGPWESVACSADGSIMLAAGGGGDQVLGPIYLSTNTGADWTQTSAPSNNWWGIVASADGTKIVAIDSIGQRIYRSSDAGSTWGPLAVTSNYWTSVASSADGTKLVVSSGGYDYLNHPPGPIYTSTNSGASWITNTVPRENWSHVSSSADGTVLLAVAGGNNTSGPIYTTTNSGATWQFRSTQPNREWIYSAMSADGSKMAAVVDGGFVYTSTNFGLTWIQSPAPNLNWNAVALSADGAFLTSSVGYPSTGGIYSFSSTPAPLLRLSSSGGAAQISWILPSLGFVLQQSSDLSNWSDLTNQPALNLSNLHNQVFLPASSEAQFYRLKNQ